MADLRRSLVITFFSNSGATLLKFIASVLLARILSPSEIGVYSMTVVFVNLAHVFRDFGVGSYLQREPDLTPDKIRSATGVLFASSWLIAAVLFCVSGSMATWFEEPDIGPVMRVLSIGFMIIPFGAVTNALLTREFAADKQAWVNAAGTISFCVSSLAFAWAGFGSIGLAYANLINIVVCAVAFIPLRPKGVPWLPAFRHWRSVTHFGLGSMLSNCAVALNNAIPDVLLGKLGSARHVGLFSRANSTVTIFTYVAGSTVSYGAVSYLSQVHHRGESLVPVLSRATVLLTGVGWTALALTAVLSKEIVLALYGAAWLESVPAILPLTLAAAIGMLFHYSPMALTAIGRPYLGAVPVTATLASQVGFGVLLFDGSLRSFAWAILVAALTAAPVMLMQLHRYFDFKAGALLRAVLPSAGVALGSAAAGAILSFLLPTTWPALIRLLAMAPVLALVWYLLLRVARHPLVGEVHRLAAPLASRLALLRPHA